VKVRLLAPAGASVAVSGGGLAVSRWIGLASSQASSVKGCPGAPEGSGVHNEHGASDP